MTSTAGHGPGPHGAKTVQVSGVPSLAMRVDFRSRLVKFLPVAPANDSRDGDEESAKRKRGFTVDSSSLRETGRRATVKFWNNSVT